MSLEERGAPGVAVHEVREAARRQARSLSSGLIVVLGALAAVVLVFGFVLLHYQFDQASHRLFKILAGCAGAAVIMLKPRLGLLLLPIATPFLSLLPKVPVPGLNTLNGLLLLVFMSWGLSRVLARQPLFRPARLGGWIGAFVLLAAISILRGAAIPTGYTYDAAATSLQLFRATVSVLGYFIAMSMVRGERDRRMLAIAIVAGLAAEAAATIAWGRNGSGGRAVGSIGQPNELGTFLAVYTALAAALIWGVRSIPGRLALGATVIAGSYAVLLSVSRGAMVALAVGLLFVAVRSSRLMTALLVVALLTSPAWAPENVRQRMMWFQDAENSDEVELENSALARVETWRAIMKLISEHPLDGVGFGGLAYVLQDTGAEMGLQEVKDSAHNTFLRAWGEMGILGFALFVGLLVMCFKLSVDGARLARSRFDRQLAIGLGGAVVALAVSCAFGDRFFQFEIVGSFWILCALVNDLLLEQRGTPP